MLFALIVIFLLTILLSAITTLPLALIVLLCLYIVFKRQTLFVLAFFMGLFLDVFLVRTLGQTSLFFLIFLMLVLLYERKFEIKTNTFIFVASFLGAFFYLLIYGSDYVFAQALVSSVIAVLLFKVLSVKLKAQS